MENYRKKISTLMITNNANIERLPTEEEIQKMLKLCQKRPNPSYYKLRHATELSEAYYFRGVDYYIIDNGKKRMRRLWDE